MSFRALAGLFTYGAVVRPWHLRWGATDEEAQRVLAGDVLLPSPTSVSTRAITIGAPPELVWPWLVQIGQDRGGLYSYEQLENLVGLGIRNADRIHPEWQQLRVGDRVKLSDERFALVVREMARPRSLVYEFEDGGWIWAFDLHEAEPGHTRLLVRNRWSSHTGGLAWRIGFWALEPVAFVMEQRMLRGIRQRVEEHAAAVDAERDLVAAPGSDGNGGVG